MLPLIPSSLKTLNTVFPGFYPIPGKSCIMMLFLSTTSLVSYAHGLYHLDAWVSTRVFSYNQINLTLFQTLMNAKTMLG